MISVYVFGVIIAVLFIAGLVVAPWVEDEPADPEGVEGEVPPEERQEAALDALQELEFEHETGKLSDEDYHRLRNRYARAAVEARDEVARDEAPRGDAPPDGAGRAGPAGGEPGADGDDGAGEGPAFCPECGAGAADGARYCGQCGSRLPG
ncbi:MAG: zinc-ribbon domain-containing protein [Gemmatimonadota bacterium]